MQRIQIWLDVENNEGGFQILQGLYAIASGGLFGTGLGESMQKLGFIPEPHNDMIFAIICEELGIVGAGIVILMFLILLWRIYDVATTSPDLFSGMIRNWIGFAYFEKTGKDMIPIHNIRIL